MFDSRFLFEDSFFSKEGMYRPANDTSGGEPVRVVMETDLPESVKGRAVGSYADYGKVTVLKAPFPRESRPFANGIFTVSGEEWRVHAVTSSEDCWVCECYKNIRGKK